MTWAASKSMTWAVETESATKVPSDIIHASQKHTNSICWAEEVTTATVADGIAAAAGFNQPFLIRSADCLPLVLLTADTACALHVSRKSLPAGLLDKVSGFLDVTAITRVHIGPHVCPEHFVFAWRGEELAAFCDIYPMACAPAAGGTSVSLRAAVDYYLQQWGVREENVTRDGRCTFESRELPSYRRSLRDGEKLAGNIYTIVRRA